MLTRFAADIRNVMYFWWYDEEKAKKLTIDSDTDLVILKYFIHSRRAWVR